MIKTLVNDTFSFNVLVAIGGTLKAARVAYGKEIGHVFPEDMLSDEPQAQSMIPWPMILSYLLKLLQDLLDNANAA